MGKRGRRPIGETTIKDSKEHFNAYMREYYKNNHVTKKEKVNNQIDDIIMMIIEANHESKVSRRDIIEKLIELKKLMETPKQQFCVPDEILSFLEEDIPNPILTNAKN